MKHSREVSSYNTSGVNETLHYVIRLHYNYNNNDDIVYIINYKFYGIIKFHKNINL